ncbi:MAG: hydroxyacid dehydrogenase [Chthoniobacteraceae bacterium]
MKKTALFLLDYPDLVYSKATQKALAEQFDFPWAPMAASQLAKCPGMMADIEVLFSSWGAPVLDEAFLDSAPRLEAIFYAAGSIRHMVSDAFWKRSIPICSAWAANAVPVAEFTASHILLALKQTHRLCRDMHRERRIPKAGIHEEAMILGAYDVKVGIIGLGMIGRMVAERLQSADLEVLAYDPYFPADEAARLGVGLTDLSTLFSECHVVSLHAPDLDSTRSMITGDLLRMLPDSSTFINTARGGLVKEDEMIAVLCERPDITAVLDVTEPEPPPTDSPLYSLQNVFLTPHIAGSRGNECHRLGDYMRDEARRYLKGEPLKWQVTPEIFRSMA